MSHEPRAAGGGRALRIGVDIDDVLVESLPEYTRRFGARFGYHVPVEECAWEIFRRFPEISPTQMSGFYSELEASDFLATRPAYPEAVEGLRALGAAGHRLVVVTGRLPEHLGHTERLLRREGLRDLFEELVHRAGDESAAEYKPRIVLERRLDLLIDDELHVAAAVGARVPVLLLNRPWNRGALPPGVSRVSTWAEILETVAKISDGVMEPGVTKGGNRWSAA
ncbi:MAG: hypothetical protein ACE147_03120 [Candidatus Methylomirabilales bacterium]